MEFGCEGIEVNEKESGGVVEEQSGKALRKTSKPSEEVKARTPRRTKRKR